MLNNVDVIVLFWACEEFLVFLVVGMLVVARLDVTALLFAAFDDGSGP